MTPDDLIIAFFPCIYFCAMSQVAFSWGATNYRKLSVREKTDIILERSQHREQYFALAIKMLTIAQERGLRLVMENPWNEQTYLKANFVIPPTLVDKNRMMRGDYFVKPTAYFFINAQPTKGFTLQNDKKKRTILGTKSSKESGLCSEERSLISPDYARNFICDFLIGKAQQHTMSELPFEY